MMSGRIIVLVMDSVGIGAQPDAADYQSMGANTFLHAAQAYPGFSITNLQKLGIGNITGMDFIQTTDQPLAHYGRMTEITAGCDTFAGIWEMAGVVFTERFASFNPKIPERLIQELNEFLGITTLCNGYISGFKVLDQFADEHFGTGQPIVYTCDDGVILVAAHETVIPPMRLQQIAREMSHFFVGKNVSRIIARSFVGVKENFVRTNNRADFVIPFDKDHEHLFQKLRKAGISLTVTQHIASLIGEEFASNILPGIKNSRGIMDSVCEYIKVGSPGISIFVVPDFDMSGHKKDAIQYAHDIMYFDARLKEVLQLIDDHDILFIVADHGCDPLLDIRGHTREYVPLLMVEGKRVVGHNLDTRDTFADLGQTICDLVGTDPLPFGKSFKIG